MKKSVVMILCFFVSFILDSKADFQFLDRSVSAENNKGSSDSKSSTDFGDFNERAIVCWETTGDGVAAPYWAGEYECGDYFASASQDSTISSNRIIANGFSEEWNPFYHPGFEPYSQSASTILSVNLAIDTPRWIDLSGTLGAWGDYGGTEVGNYYTEIRLSSQTETIYSASISGLDSWLGLGPDQIQINETIFLNPGTYSFYAEATSEGSYSSSDIAYYGVGGGGYANFDLELIPERCTLLLFTLGSLALRYKRQRS